MPLSTKGYEIKNKFKKQYGSKRGERYFYATENKNKRFARAVKAH